MVNIKLQYFGGRGSGGGKRSGGGGGANAKGSASNPIASKEFDSMDKRQRTAALNAMPIGTRVLTHKVGYEDGGETAYVKTSEGWKAEYTYTEASRRTRRNVTKKGYYSANTDAISNERNTLRYIRYPK